MQGSDVATLELRGGCQCGSVRYAALVEDDEAYYCHCRMCQKAFGNLFGAFFFALEDSVVWEVGEPTYFRSSKIARRGFCRECGTPLSFEDLESGEVHLTVGSLDEPERLHPVAHYGFECHVGSFFTNDGLPRSRTEDDEEYVARWKNLHGRDSMPGRCPARSPNPRRRALGDQRRGHPRTPQGRSSQHTSGRNRHFLPRNTVSNSGVHKS